MRVVIAAFLVWAAAGCGGDDGCVPGASAACTCTDGRSGAQTCLSDRTLGACMCEGAIDAGGSDAGVAPEGGEIFVLDLGDTSVRVFDRFAEADGTPPADTLRILRGGNTQLTSPVAIAVHDGRGELFVANAGDDSITVYPADADGNVAPIRRIVGPSTGLQLSDASYLGGALHVDEENGEIWVLCTDDAADGCALAFAVDADGDAAPLRAIRGSATTLPPAGAGNLLRGIFVDAVHDELLVANDSRVVVFDREADGDVAPLRALGVRGRVWDVGVDDANGELWVLHAMGYVDVYARTASDGAASLRSYDVATGSGLERQELFLDPERGEATFSNDALGIITFDMGTGGPVREFRGGLGRIWSFAVAP